MPSKFNRKDFLEALFFNYCKDKNGFILVKTSDRNFVKTSTRYFPNPDSLAREQYADDLHVYFGVCPREKMKPGKEFVRHLAAVWMGIDIGPEGHSGKDKGFATDKQAIMAVKSFQLHPSIVVQSGRGFHLYWLLKELKEVTDVEAVEGTLRRLADFFQCGGEVGLDSFLRLPETWNPKHPQHPMECRVQFMDASLRYDFADFENLDLRLIIPSKKAPKVLPPPPVPPVRSRVTVIHDESQPMDMPSGDAPVYVGHPDPPEHRPVPPRPTSAALAEPGAGDVPEASMDRLMDRFVDAFSERHLDRLADKIAHRILESMGSSNAKR